MIFGLVCPLWFIWCLLQVSSSSLTPSRAQSATIISMMSGQHFGDLPDRDTSLSLVQSDRVTWILASHWSRVQTPDTWIPASPEWSQDFWHLIGLHSTPRVMARHRFYPIYWRFWRPRRNVALYWKWNIDWWTIFPAETIITDGQNPQTSSFTFWQGYFKLINFGGNMADAFKLKFIWSFCSNKHK